MSIVKPPFTYYGGKTRTADRIVAVLPSHEHYVEPFAGGLSVLLAKPRSVMETVNDLDNHLVTFWRVLRDRPDDLVRVCSLTPHARAEFESAGDLDVDDDLEHARRAWVRLSQGRSGKLTPTGWRYYKNPGGSSMGMPGYIDSYVNRMVAVAGRLKCVSIESRPALELIADYGKQPRVLFYLDPPYLDATRNSRGYLHEMADVAQHRALAASVNSVECKASVVISGYHSDLYDELYAGWHRLEIETWTGNARALTADSMMVDGARTEVLWSNRPIGGQGRLELA